jgi:tRNA modification GTPase
MDTIFALATAPGRAGVAVIRVSGPGALAAGRALAGSLPTGRGLRRLRGIDGSVIDQALVLVFSEGASFTGEAAVEFHCHGSPAVIRAVEEVLAVQPGLRPARAGEFTERAFLNGRLDLAQVEGLADLIDAETDKQRRQAMQAFQGALGGWVAALRSDLIAVLALIEAGIDFADEDIPDAIWDEVDRRLREVRGRIEAELTGIGAAERVRAGFTVAILGAPNLGKSTLLNRIVGRDVAITSPIPGTTRDVIEAQVEIGGLAVTLLDTAGLRESLDQVESLGIERARLRAEEADVRIILVERGEAPAIPSRPDDILVEAFGDLPGAGPEAVSGLTGAGVPAVLARLAETLRGRVAGAGVANRDRHRSALMRAQVALLAAGDRIGMPELLAEELRTCLRALDSLVGRVDVEDLLDQIFSRFCIGK